jgi:hypothetical protein
VRDLQAAVLGRDSSAASRPASCSNSGLLRWEWTSSLESNAAAVWSGRRPGIERRCHLRRALHGGGSTRGPLAPGVDAAGKVEEVPPSAKRGAGRALLVVILFFPVAKEPARP